MSTEAQVLLNQSQISSWLSCQYQWDLQYRRGLRPRRDKPALRVGSCGHQVMAALLTNRSAEEAADKWRQGALNASEAWTDEDITEIDTLHDKGYKLAKRAYEQLDIGHKWATVEFDGKPLVEYQFLLPEKLGKFTHFSGTLDWVAKDLQQGMQFLVDHKFRKQLQPTEAEEHNLQMACYQKLMNRAGIKTVGSISHQIRTELPREPSINKNGSISKALIISDWRTYSEFVVNQGQNPDDYVEMIDKLGEIEFWRMSYAYRNDLEVDTIWDSCVRPVALTISENPRIYRTIKHMTCRSCFVREYCWAEMRGGDTKFLEQTQFSFGPSSKPDAYQQTILEEDED